MTNPRDDQIISRVIDGDASQRDWNALESIAARDPAVWRRLALALRDHAGFVRAVNASVRAADAVEAPVTLAGAVPAAGAGPHRTRRLGTWAGWAAAAVVALAWGSTFLRPPGVTTLGEHAGFAEAIRSAPAADLIAAYLDRGRAEDRVIGELPERVLLDSRPAESGDGYELLYLRQILERVTVPDLYEYTAQDEAGRPMLTPVRAEQGRGPSL